MENNFEIRNITELRANTETSTVTGTAIVFNQESVLMGAGGAQFKEKILPEAATETFLKAQPDIVMRYNHQEDSVLARYRSDAQRNSLSFFVDAQGVHFEFRAKKKDAWLLEDIKNGDLNACSFAFRIAPEEGAEKWEKRSDGTYLRTISKFAAVGDFSIVVNPSYEATSVSTRGLDELKQKEEIEGRATVTDMETKRKELGMSLSEFYAIPNEDVPSDSKLAIFDKSHTQDAMARFNQLKDVSPEDKAKAKKKIVATAHKFDIDTTNFEEENKSAEEVNAELEERDRKFNEYFMNLCNNYLPKHNK